LFVFNLFLGDWILASRIFFLFWHLVNFDEILFQAKTRDTHFFKFFLFKLIPFRFYKSYFFVSVYLLFYSCGINLLFLDFFYHINVLLSPKTWNIHLFELFLFRLLFCRWKSSNFFLLFFWIHFHRIITLHLDHTIP